mmetsp:Transcript_27055/g.31482  ORF Transcript_27055/g.31482 Transcript_27055/m.31482 type:complete len:158 (+) Transcript_27055:168-641(+)
METNGMSNNKNKEHMRVSSIESQDSILDGLRLLSLINCEETKFDLISDDEYIYSDDESEIESGDESLDSSTTLETIDSSTCSQDSSQFMETTSATQPIKGKKKRNVSLTPWFSHKRKQLKALICERWNQENIVTSIGGNCQKKLSNNTLLLKRNHGF